MRPLRWSRCRGAKDWNHQRAGSDWEALVNEVITPIELNPELEHSYAKRSIPAIIPAVWHPHLTGRTGEGIDYFDILGLDVDNSSKTIVDYYEDMSEELNERCCDNPVTPQELVDKATAAGLATCGHSTYSHKDSWPKARVFTALSRPIRVEELPAAQELFLSAMGLQDRRASIDIPVIRTPNRIYFRAGYMRGAQPPYIWHTPGECLQVPQDLSGVPVPPVGDRARTEVARQRLEQLRAERYALGYSDKEDWYTQFPINFPTLRIGDLLEEMTGRRVKPWSAAGEGYKARCHCPWAFSHGKGVDDDCAVVFVRESGWPNFFCSHSSHSNKSLKDVCEKAGAALLLRHAEPSAPQRISAEDIAALEGLLTKFRRTK